jgi:hypothetical protein
MTKLADSIASVAARLEGIDKRLTAQDV